MDGSDFGGIAVNCTQCGTPLPPGALFCGECGTSVASASNRAAEQPAGARSTSVGASEARRGGARPVAQARWIEGTVTGESLIADVPEVDVELGPGDTRCDQCGTVMAHDDIFCPECGFVSRSITRAFSNSDFAGETRQLDFGPIVPTVQAPVIREPVAVEPEAPVAVEPEAPVAVEPIAEDPVVDKASGEPPADLVVDRSAPIPDAPVLSAPTEPEHRRGWSAPLPPLPVVPPANREDDEDIEATRIVNRLSGDRFVLQFSTGESFTVHGSGLIGRNPRPEPGEFFDHLVRVFDAGKSVSKTHLEFGQEQGAFWVKDRFSGNGTVIREPDISARRAEADRRYRLVRGTRVDIGEQFFVIS